MVPSAKAEGRLDPTLKNAVSIEAEIQNGRESHTHCQESKLDITESHAGFSGEKKVVGG